MHTSTSYYYLKATKTTLILHLRWTILSTLEIKLALLIVSQVLILLLKHIIPALHWMPMTTRNHSINNASITYTLWGRSACRALNQNLHPPQQRSSRCEQFYRKIACMHSFKPSQLLLNSNSGCQWRKASISLLSSEWYGKHACLCIWLFKKKYLTLSFWFFYKPLDQFVLRIHNLQPSVPLT